MIDKMTESKELYGEVEIGEDVPQVEAKPCIIKGYKIDPIIKDSKEIGKKVLLLVNHPQIIDKDIEISGVKYQDGDKIKNSGLWWKLDKDGKIPYKSALSNLLRHYNKSNLMSLKETEVETVVNDNGYLAIKAY